jgi:hypothetical protein
MALDVFEKEGGAAGFGFRVAVKAGLRDAIGDLGDFEVGRDFFTDAAEFAGFVEDFDPVSEVVVGQGGSLRSGFVLNYRTMGRARGAGLFTRGRGSSRRRV